MIQKIGAAFKKMAQRSMMRGNRGDAQAVTSFGIEGMRNNLLSNSNPLSSSTAHVSTGVHEIYAQESTRNTKNQVAGNQQKTANTTKSVVNAGKKLGSSIMDALK